MNPVVATFCIVISQFIQELKQLSLILRVKIVSDALQSSSNNQSLAIYPLSKR